MQLVSIFLSIQVENSCFLQSFGLEGLKLLTFFQIFGYNIAKELTCLIGCCPKYKSSQFTYKDITSCGHRDFFGGHNFHIENKRKSLLNLYFYNIVLSLRFEV